MSLAGTDWAVDRIVSVTDGDSLRVVRSRVVGVEDEIEIIARDRNPKGVAIRLITLDTPERGEPGHDEARADVLEWLATQGFLGKSPLRIETWPGGGFDRLLGDIYAGDRSNTLSQWMLREKGWLPYVRGV